MKYLLPILLVLSLLAFPGCGNLSPQNRGTNRQKINNQNGKIDDIRSELQELQGVVNAQVGNIRNETKIQAEKINSMQQQQGILNRENSGFQLLQGDGALILILCLAILGTVALFGVLHYREIAKKNEEATQILAEQIVCHNNADLEDKVFGVALHSTAGKEVLHAIKKYQKFRAT